MSTLTVALSGLLLASVVTAGSINALRRHNPNWSGSDSSEEYDRYWGSKQGKNANQAASSFVPMTFDARDYWAQCPSVRQIPYQGCCKSNFAMIPTAVMTDRTCIATNSSNVVFSAYDPITCCAECVKDQADVCDGGDPVEVWKYWSKTGITTEECLPYPFNKTCTDQNCPIRCVSAVSGTVAGNKKKGLKYYTMPPNVLQIQAEIFHHGPVEASFDMKLDFILFNGTGVYIHSYGSFVAEHSVKIIGWGTDNGTPYWLIVNTYGLKWGDQGVAKFLRGENHMSIEANVRAAKPDV